MYTISLNIAQFLSMLVWGKLHICSQCFVSSVTVLHGTFCLLCVVFRCFKTSKVCLSFSGDWVAVKVQTSRQDLSSKQRAISKAFMHLAWIKDIDAEDSVCTVSFVKKQPDGLYCWPDPEDISDVDMVDCVKMSSPSETIISGASSTVRVKLSFNRGDINAARMLLKVPVANVY